MMELNTHDIEAVLAEFGVCDGLINTDENDVLRMAAEVVALREVLGLLGFADGVFLRDRLRAIQAARFSQTEDGDDAVEVPATPGEY